MDKIKYPEFLRMFQIGSDPLHYGFWRIFSKLNLLTKRSIRYTTVPISIMHRSRVGAIKYFLCMFRRYLYYWQNDRYATQPCLPVLCIEAAWARSTTFCVWLEGAYTIDKTIDTLVQTFTKSYDTSYDIVWCLHHTKSYDGKRNIVWCHTIFVG